MSLLDRGNFDVIVYPEITTTDADGNVHTRASTTGIPARAMIQVASQSGTSARRAEQDNEGFESEEVYRVRFTRADDAKLGPLGPQSKIEWNGYKWSVFGFRKVYAGGRRTRHHDYLIIRS